MQTTTAVRLERILVAVDFFPPSKHALRYAVHFAKLFEAKLFLVHVAERIGLGIGDETPTRFDDADRGIKGVRKNLQALIASASIAGSFPRWPIPLTARPWSWAARTATASCGANQKGSGAWG